MDTSNHFSTLPRELFTSIFYAQDEGKIILEEEDYFILERVCRVFAAVVLDCWTISVERWHLLPHVKDMGHKIALLEYCKLACKKTWVSYPMVNKPKDLSNPFKVIKEVNSSLQYLKNNTDIFGHSNEPTGHFTMQSTLSKIDDPLELIATFNMLRLADVCHPTRDEINHLYTRVNTIQVYWYDCLVHPNAADALSCLRSSQLCEALEECLNSNRFTFPPPRMSFD